MTANRSLCHYPSISSKDNEAPPWLPWKLFKSDGAKIRQRTRNADKRGSRQVPLRDSHHIPLMNAFLVDSLSKLSERPLRPVFPSADRFTPDMERPTTRKLRLQPLMRRRWKSTFGVENSDNKTDASILRPSFSYQRARSELSKKGRKSRALNFEAYGKLDISQWSIEGTPHSALNAAD